MPEDFHARSLLSVKSVKSPKTCRLVADETPRRTGEKTSGTQGMQWNVLFENWVGGEENKRQERRGGVR